MSAVKNRDSDFSSVTKGWCDKVFHRKKEKAVGIWVKTNFDVFQTKLGRFHDHNFKPLTNLYLMFKPWILQTFYYKITQFQCCINVSLTVYFFISIESVIICFHKSTPHYLSF